MTTQAFGDAQRNLIGVMAVALLAAGAWSTYTADATDFQAWSAASLKIGVVMAVVWLAYPQVVRIPTWVLLACLAGGAAALIFARQPRVLLMAAAITLIILRLRPPRGKSPSR